MIRAWADGTGGLTVYDGYGQSETAAMVANYRCLPVRPGSMGKPVPGWDVDVFDDEGARCDDDTVGNIAIRLGGDRPVGLFDGYDGDDEANAKSFRDGLVLHRRQGLARRRRLPLVRGPRRRRDHLVRLPDRPLRGRVGAGRAPGRGRGGGGRQGRPGAHPDRLRLRHPRRRPRAGDAALAKELQDFAKNLTAPYKYPREIHFVDELPKTISGKIRRSELRAQLGSGAFD